MEPKTISDGATKLGISAAKTPSSSLDKITAEYLENELISRPDSPGKNRRVKIIGVDCAVKRKNVGLAVGLLEDERVTMLAPEHGIETKWAGAGASEIAAWMNGDDPVLLAFDAPLGWPIAMAQALARARLCRAGDPISAYIKRANPRPLCLQVHFYSETRHQLLAADQNVRRDPWHCPSNSVHASSPRNIL